MTAISVRLCLAVVAVLVSSNGLGTAAHAQRTDEREVMRLPKTVSNLAWVDATTVLATLTGKAWGNREVVIIDLSKQDIRFVAQGGCGSPSPDRTTMAWIPGPATRGGVWLMDLRSGTRRPLVEERGAGCLAWSPDGRRVAVLSVDQTGVSNKDDIQIIDASTGRITDTIVNDNLFLDQLAWTHDSQRLAFAAFALDLFRTQPGGRLYPTTRVDVYSLRDRRRTVLMQVSQDRSAHDLAFSANSRVLAMAIDRQIYLYDGADAKPLTTGGNPLWLADGRSILFSRGYDCTGYLCAGDALYTISLP